MSIEMLDMRNMTFDGVAQSYFTMPMYLMDNLANDNKLTSSAIYVYIRLFAYASCVNTTSFGITTAWVAKNTGLNRKTVERALDLLAERGYIDQEGICVGEPQAKQPRAIAKNNRAGRFSVAQKPSPAKATDTESTPVVSPAVVVNMESAQETVKESMAVEPVGNSDTLQQDHADELNAMLRSLGSTKKVGQKVQPVEKQADKMPQPSGQIVQKDGQKGTSSGQKGTSHITIQDKQSKIKHSSTPSVAVGVLPSTSSSGFVEPSKPKSLATMLQGFTAGKPKPALHGKHSAYIETALKRMMVTSPSERARYQSEIAYAATQGAFAETFSHTPLKAIRACLNLVEAGRWKANGGMYA